MKHFVEYYDGRRFFTEGYTAEVPERTIPAALAAVPEYAFGFRFFDMVDEIPNPPDLGPGLRVSVTRIRQNISGMHFIGGQILTVDDVRALAKIDPQNYRILLANMEGNGWANIVKTRSGNTRPLEAGDCVVL